MKKVFLLMAGIAILQSWCFLSYETKLPVDFDGNLLGLNLKLYNGESMKFYLDTGGKNYLYKSGLKKLNLKKKKSNLYESSNLETFLTRQSFPTPKQKDLFYVKEKDERYDGMLGREWFIDKIWVIDYLRKEFYYQEIRKASRDKRIGNLYFKKTESGETENGLPRTDVFVDGERYSMLVDLGAQVDLSIQAQEQLKLKPKSALSFIDQKTFDLWKEAHPDWKVIEKGDAKNKEDLIEVPRINLGSLTMGPVWFAKRQNENFEVLSELFMDAPTQGALGGNAFSLLGSITLDYAQGGIYHNRND